MFASLSLILSLAAIFSFINHKYLRLPMTIGLLILSLVTSAVIIGLEGISGSAYRFFCQILFDIDFKSALLDVMLSFLLFAGALHVDLKELKKQTLPVLLFATLGVLISTVVVGGLVFVLSSSLAYPIDLIYCLLFGALISPTDPIAVLSILKKTKVDMGLKMEIEGESLFNDGVGVVVFLSVVGFASGMDQDYGLVDVSHLVLLEVGGGLLFGFVLGWLGWILLRSVQDDPKICVMITLAIAMSGYALASLLHVSGPIAMVVGGLFIGRLVRRSNFSKGALHFLESIWDMIDDVLNAVLFVLIGLAVFILEFETIYVYLGLAAIAISLIGRFLALGIPFSFLKSQNGTSRLNSLLFLTWGGLRGGISIALALSLSDDILVKDGLVFMTYFVVVFSIIVQGLSLNRVAKSLGISA